jgi:SAM-dependent methyltransferase
VLFEDRSRAESFGAAAELYDRARPSYPPSLVDVLLAGGASGVLDVGCGTGIAGALFAARGCAVLGVEVDPRMAAIARSKGLEVDVAAFEHWADRGRRFDLVISGQAWHWVQPTAGATKAAAVLGDGGRIGVFWNFGDPPAQVRERLAPVYRRLAPELKNYSILLDNADARTRDTVGALSDSARFEAAEVCRFPWSQTYETGQWLEQLSTHSDHRSLSPARLERLLGAICDAIDTIGGRFKMHYETILVTASALHGNR